MIVGTAGHIDHGKSALVEALTGRRMDRLAEERRRGITIDLNFAPLDLGPVQAGVVDVPGHEDFVRTMVAGASGVDLVLLVVAADEGIMPQTREHLAIVEQLGVPAGIPVITKADLVEPDWLDLVRGEVNSWLSHSPIHFTPAFAVASPSGRGIAELKAEIARLARSADPRGASDYFRLPVDRAFSTAGVGTVVTGTAWSGSVGVGDVVRVLPSRREARVRSIEIHGRQASRSQPRERNALGLAGIERADIGRGDWLVSPQDPWVAVTALDVALRRLDPEGQPLPPRTRVRVLLGTGEVLARVHPREEYGPGRSTLARLALEKPLVARGGDRLVLRSYSPVSTIGGGRVLDPNPPRRGATWTEDLRADEPLVRLRALVGRRRYGITIGEIPLLLGCHPDQVEGLLAVSGLRRLNEKLVRSDLVDEVSKRAIAEVKAHRQKRPDDLGVPLETLRKELRAPAWLVEAALADLVTNRALEIDGAVAREPGRPRAPAVPEGDVDRVVAAVVEGGLTPPSVAELEQRLGRHDVVAILKIAAGQGRVTAVERDRYFATPALDRFVAVVREVGAGGDIAPAALRERLGLSRKFLIPLLEWSDARGVTVRNGESRRLR
jgi:selenocysteine-specific elongation factor